MLNHKDYHYLFHEHAVGKQVLEELTGMFYDIQSYTKGDHLETAFKEGQRSVIRLVLQKMALAETQDIEE